MWRNQEARDFLQHYVRTAVLFSSAFLCVFRGGDEKYSTKSTEHESRPYSDCERGKDNQGFKKERKLWFFGSEEQGQRESWYCIRMSGSDVRSSCLRDSSKSSGHFQICVFGIMWTQGGPRTQKGSESFQKVDPSFSMRKKENTASVYEIK